MRGRPYTLGVGISSSRGLAGLLGDPMDTDSRVPRFLEAFGAPFRDACGRTERAARMGKASGAHSRGFGRPEDFHLGGQHGLLLLKFLRVSPGGTQLPAQ